MCLRFEKDSDRLQAVLQRFDLLTAEYNIERGRAETLARYLENEKKAHTELVARHEKMRVEFDKSKGRNATLGTAAVVSTIAACVLIVILVR